MVKVMVTTVQFKSLDGSKTATGTRRRWLLRVLVPVFVLLLLLLLLPLLTSSSYSPSSFLASFSSMAPPVKASPQESAALAKSLNAFTLDMYLALSKQEASGNVFFSPFSVLTALSMTLLGARKATHAQLRAALRLTGDDEALKRASEATVLKYKEEVTDYTLATANMMYVSNALDINPAYQEAVIKHFKATAEVVDFSHHEAVRAAINEAVEKVTNSLIKDLIPANALNPLTRLVLVNAVYFKGLWVQPFEKDDTRDEPFWTAEDASVDVPMMHTCKKFKYADRKDLDATVLALDYKGGNLSMVVVLPNKRMGLAEVEAKLAGTDLRQLAQAGRSVEVEVSLPKFKMEYFQDLVGTLKELGVNDLFVAGKSDLSGIGGEPGSLYVSKVLHKAFVEVNEEGTEAAAATAVVAMTRMMIHPPPPPFIADHPFMFFIYDSVTSTPLFVGRYATPSVDTPRQEL